MPPDMETIATTPLPPPEPSQCVSSEPELGGPACRLVYLTIPITVPNSVSCLCELKSQPKKSAS